MELLFIIFWYHKKTVTPLFLNRTHCERVKTRTLINSQLLGAPDSQRRLAGVWLIHKTVQIERFTASLLCFGFNTKTKPCLHVKVTNLEQRIWLYRQSLFYYLLKTYIIVIMFELYTFLANTIANYTTFASIPWRVCVKSWAGFLYYISSVFMTEIAYMYSSLFFFITPLRIHTHFM